MFSTSATILSAAGEQVPYSAALLVEGRLPVEITDHACFSEGCWVGYVAGTVGVAAETDRYTLEEERDTCLTDLYNGGFRLDQLAADSGYVLGWLSALWVRGMVEETFVEATLCRFRALVNDRLSMLV